MKKFLLMLVTAFLVTAMVAGCGGAATPETPATEAPTQAATDAPAEVVTEAPTEVATEAPVAEESAPKRRKVNIDIAVDD